LVGYTNAGKSTLLNRLSGSDVYTADQLFATLDPTTRRVDSPWGQQLLVSDTVGFIQKLPTQLVASFRATLEEIAEADLLVHVVDVVHPDAVEQAETVERVLRELGMVELPMVVAANKIDLLPGYVPPGDRPSALSGTTGAPDYWPDGEPAALARIREIYPDAVLTSAADGVGLAELLVAAGEELKDRLVAVDVLVPYSAGHLLSAMHTQGVVEDETFEPAGTRVRAKVPPLLMGEITRLGQAPAGRLAGPDADRDLEPDLDPDAEPDRDPGSD
jgi:GTP-binding protein HflX